MFLQRIPLFYFSIVNFPCCLPDLNRCSQKFRIHPEQNVPKNFHSGKALTDFCFKATHFGNILSIVTVDRHPEMFSQINRTFVMKTL